MGISVRWKRFHERAEDGPEGYLDWGWQSPELWQPKELAELYCRLLDHQTEIFVPVPLEALQVLTEEIQYREQPIEVVGALNRLSCALDDSRRR